MNGSRVLRSVLVVTLLGVLLYAVLLFIADWRAVVEALAGFDLLSLAVVLALSLVCYFSRSIRLRYLMAEVDAPIGLKDALYVQFSGMTMTITPGKLGEVMKAVLAKEIAGLPISNGVALVFVERLSDLLAVLLISVGGLALLDMGAWALVAAAAVTVGGVVLLSMESFHERVLAFIEGRRWAGRYHLSAAGLLGTIHTTLKPRPLAVSLALSVVGWGAEAVAFFLTLRALGFDGLSIFPAMAIYAVATIAGALAFFPGGLGLTEGSMMGILVALGATRDVAFSATMIIRFATLWFGVGLGWMVFATRPALMRGFLRGGDEESPASGDR